MTRRDWLVASGAALTATIGTIGVLRWHEHTSAPRSIEEMSLLIRELLGGLDITETELIRFLEDARNQDPTLFSQSINESAPGEDLARILLLSSDLFRGKPESVGGIHYLSYYDPYLTPCLNPFAEYEAE